ncbi:MAG: transcription-repair coupling factor [Leptospiraceae bacterium]|nr:transcription-repair coupling factor [Leptospiraceae bacterium]MDW8306721.1 transcription-repair coupling factor [Leptospiraceae bacterium]
MDKVVGLSDLSNSSSVGMLTTSQSAEALLLQEFEEHCQKRLSPLPQKLAPVFPAALSFLLYTALSRQSKATALICVPEENLARRVFKELWFLAQVDPHLGEILYLATPFTLPYSYARPDPEKEGMRSRTLATLLSGKKCVVIASIDALTIKTIHPQKLKGKSFLLKSHDMISQKALFSFLQETGYERKDMAEKPGDFAVKGSIVDVFCPAYFNPIRLDFFGDELESLGFFDPLSQKSITKLREITLYPVREILLSREEINELERRFEREGKQKHPPPFLSSAGQDVAGLFDIFPLVLEAASVLSYFPQDLTLFMYDEEGVRKRAEQLYEERQFLYEKNTDKWLAAPSTLFLKWEELDAHLPLQRNYLLPIPRSGNELHPLLYESPQFRGRISQVIDFLQKEDKKKIFISLKSEVQRERLEHILAAYEEIPQLHIFLSPLEGGFYSEDFILLTEHEIFGKARASVALNKNTTRIIESFLDLKEGDFVVHVNYGLARFVGLRRMKVAGVERDFLELEFAEKAKLYVPLEQLKLVHRYIGSTENPRLDYLGKKSQWEKTKERVKEHVNKLAVELLDLYARRQEAKGYAFPPDTTFQEEFEASFPYEETEHQLAAILDVKRDMEQEKPMDRLICGDVGFGKTEVAIRAAFKAVMAGKQVAVLCPTTILAFQHFQTFSQRLRNYPIGVDYLSRFRTPREIKTIKERLLAGKIDILIGTHALLSKSVRFKNLGLLIIDEEQRFGVVHKEAIKKLKHNLDCLTLTATPIPRTLYMSLAGIRDLSLIETPPRNRQKIETYVLEESEEILRAAIANELKRQGQVYVLHNKVKTIDAQANRIKQLVPSARVAILHGQMEEEEIEKTMLEFYKGNYDILVTTTIIESGIDIPNVNTLIVMNAQEFGLSQLYQLKGRVGRSERQAYAYFFYPADKSVSETAQKRLNTLQEYDELGAGFKIAMKDLEIRGAGNILGAEQSGDIMEVGFELYLEMLQEKIAELRREPKKEEIQEAVVSIRQNFFFPDDYIPDTRQKMEFYKKLMACGSLEDLEAVWDELLDRFGDLPEQVESMLLQEKIKLLATQLGMEKIEQVENGFSILAAAHCRAKPERVLAVLQKDRRFQLDARNPRRLFFKVKLSSHALRELAEVLQSWL